VQAGVAPYESCLDGVNALTFASKDEYLEKLDRLAKDPLLRKRIGQAAYDYAREHRNLDKNIDLWMEAYHQLAKGQPAETAAASEAKAP
jgi:glycosyltransferase involved in cell wall biosynthesis